MTPRIEVSESTFLKLQGLAEPFVDTPETVITRLILSYERNSKPDDRSKENDSTKRFEPDNAPDLTFTKLRIAKVGDNELPKPNWAQLVRHLLGIGLQKIGFEELQKISGANIVRGPKSEDGYAYIPELGISMQGEDAKDCWSIALSLARRLSLPIFVEFEWRNRAEAEMPGQSGSMFWQPKLRS